MRGQDQTSRRVRGRAWSGVVFAAALAWPAGAAFGVDATDADEPPRTRARPSPTDPIDLAARRVRVWDADGLRWVHLVGRASVVQGADAVRGDEALVRVRTVQGPGGATHEVDVYAEAVESPPRTPVRAHRATAGDVRLKAFEAGGIVPLKAPPVRLPLLARSGWDARPDGAAVAHTVAKPIALADEPPPATPPENVPDRDPVVVPAQFPGQIPATDDPGGFGGGELPPVVEPPALDRGPTVPELPPVDPGDPPTTVEPIPGPAGGPAPPLRPDGPARRRPGPPTAPILSDTNRVTFIYPRSSNPEAIRGLPIANGVETFIIKGGVNIVTKAPQFGTIDISADSVILWRKVGPDGKGAAIGPNGEQRDDARQPLEFYLEGDVIVRQDEGKVNGNGDQKTYRAKQAYYDVATERFIGVDAELDMFAPGLIAPARILSPRIEQYRPLVTGADGRPALGLAEIRADRTLATGSRFPNPGYRFNSRSVDVFRVASDETEPNTGRRVGDPADPNGPQDLTWKIDARQNVFWLGYVPVFYWPRFVAEADDLEPPLRQFTFRTNNYFGQQLLSDWNGFRLFNIDKPKNVDVWNLDLDYLSARTKNFPALGSEIGWFGGDLLNDLSDPYRRQRGRTPSVTRDYFGYFDVWGLRDYGNDTLGSGPAIITNNLAAGNAGYQRGGGGPKGSVPAFQDFRGRLSFRHMQRFLPDDDEHLYEDLRAQVEVGTTSDRYFLEEYYKRLFDVGMDQETVFYLIRQKRNWAYSVWTEANLQNWQTETQWLPKLDYYRLGDSLVSNWFTYFQHSGADYANTHTAVEVNNPHIFAFLPYDPISNTSGVFKSFRGYTNHELDMPLNFGNVFRLVPYAQGQAVGWDNQINGGSLGRVWGAVGARAEVMAWKAYPWVESEILNVHGLNHKINLEADARAAYANQHLDSIGVQDDLDDNSYESTRRYLALTNYAGGLLPPQYDPRHLMLRRALSPITGPTDIQGSLQTAHLGLHQRLQTKRGPDGKRRIIDYMTLDLDTTFFPNPSRDNFGKPFGQNTYNWQWFLGDRTSFMSYGWFEFWNISGNPIYHTNTSRHNDPFGLNVVTSGFNITRPPRGNVFIGYSVINTGPINTSALNLSSSYYLSPKWYGSYTTMYDFGNGILLAAMFSLTRIGADYLTSVGLTVDPQRQSYMFAFMVSPRLSPNVKLGNAVGLNNFDSRYAPTQ